MRKLFLLPMLLSALLFSACTNTVDSVPDSPSPETPSITLTETSPPEPTSSPIPTQTNTPAPTLSPTPIPPVELEMGELETIDHGGFSFRKIENYSYTYRPGSVTLANNEDMIVITLGGGFESENVSADDAILELTELYSRLIEKLVWSETYPIEILGYQGLTLDLEGVLLDEDMVGKVIYVQPYNQTFFAIVAVSPEEIWSSVGEVALNLLIDDLKIFQPTPMENFCPISTDPAYGYSKQKPIGVATGDILEGPSLERAYLDMLLGPNGQEIEYIRTGSSYEGDTILDEYEITYENPSTTVILYLNMYSLDPYQVPQGFICVWSVQ